MPSTATKLQRDAIIKEFNKSVSLAQNGEVILVIVVK